jgi:hypothetical protein
VDEAEVHHLVGFVEHEDLDAEQDRVMLIDQVDEAARRRDDDVDAAGEIGLVLVDRSAAEHGATESGVPLANKRGRFRRSGWRAHGSARGRACGSRAAGRACPMRSGDRSREA